MINKQPLVTCIMSNYNTDIEMLKQSIDSIISQTYKNIEFIIIDDCSTDNSFECIQQYARLDKRIKVIRNSINHGLAYSLNKAIELANGEYIARMDTDDIAFPNRFTEQVEFMENNRNIGISGTFAKNFGTTSSYSFSPLISSKELKCSLLFSSSLLHPTIMFRTEMIKKSGIRYNAEYRCSQDFDMWTRAIDFTEIAVIPKVLLKYRTHSKQVSSAKKSMQQEYAKEISGRQLKKFITNFSDEDVQINECLCNLRDLDIDSFTKMYFWIEKLLKANKKSQVYDQRILNYVLKNRAFNLLIKSGCSLYEKTILIIRFPKLITLYNIYSIIYRVVHISWWKVRGLS